MIGSKQEDLYQQRLAYRNSIVKRKRKEQLMEIRNDNLHRMFPLASTTLIKFHQTLSQDLYLYQDALEQAILNQRLDELSPQDYLDLLYDILYLSDKMKLKIHMIELLKTDFQFTTQLVSRLYDTFGPVNVGKWVGKMTDDERLLVYICIVQDEAVNYLSEPLIAMALDDLLDQQAAQLIEFSLARGIRVKQILHSCMKELPRVLTIKQRLGLCYLNIVYNICLRKVNEDCFGPLKETMLVRLPKVLGSSQVETKQIQRQAQKLRELKPSQQGFKPQKQSEPKSD